jgi:hypothetical protein
MRRVLAVVCLLAVAGCGGPLAGDSPDTPPQTATPAPVPTGAEAYPPGVSSDDVNATRLAAATVRSLNGSTYALTADRLRGVPDQSLTTTFVGPRTRVRAASPRRYVRRNVTLTTRDAALTLERFENASYATGDRLLRYDGNDTRARPLTQRDAGVGARLAGTLVARYLTAASVRVEQQPNGSVRVTGRSIARDEWRDYSLQALVAPDGTVIRFNAVFATDDEVRLVRFRLDRSATFEPPPWARTEQATGIYERAFRATNALGRETKEPRPL